MADIDMEKLIDVIHDKMKALDMNPNKISVATGLEYSTVSDALKRRYPPKLETLQKIIRALGYEFTEIIDSGPNILYLNDVDNVQFRKYRRLNDDYQKMIWIIINALLLLQEQEDIERMKIKKAARKAAKEGREAVETDDDKN